MSGIYFSPSIMNGDHRHLNLYLSEGSVIRLEFEIINEDSKENSV
jgi:hypothetical protein